ncbi:hypothetical protein CBR_g61491 [Chara braunii]|uniref:CCHC-type domain-containing protein n=1 Tax=Chara braunii TaxID=69332 RepID=A0A388K8R7_CHABU|nr:hypothetical protein CBR_g61491 [Chara braunii]|eukprot:GBG66448.1 hypothetical protein CBR_g61491 [Chara braunii]
MAGGGYRGLGRDKDRDRCQDYRRDFGPEDNRERVRDGRGDRQGEFDRGPYYERSQDYRQQPRRSAPVCGEPGHYRNQCPRLIGEGSSRTGLIRGRSLSPNRQHLVQGKWSLSEDPVAKQQLEELASSIVSMKELFDKEQEKKIEKARRKQEKKEREERDKEERLAAKRREEKKEEKLRREEADRERFRKEMRMQISMDVGGLGEHLQRTIDRAITHAKGKGKAAKTHSDAESYESESSDVEALSNQAERLVISEKRKRDPEKAVGDSPPMETPAKQSAKQGALNPVRLTKHLQLSCRRPPMKRATPPRKTPQRGVWRNKIPASVGPMGKLRFVTENLKALGNMTMDQLKEVCRLEDVQFETRKMETILAIAEKRTLTAYGSEHDEEEEQGAEQEDPAAEVVTKSDAEDEDES